MFQRNMLPPISGSKRSKPAGWLAASWAYSLTLKMEVICSSKMSVKVYQTTMHHPRKQFFIVTIMRTANIHIILPNPQIN
jgi:predicted deacetylase